MDFKSIGAVQFGFVQEAADQARRIEGYTLKGSRRRMAMLAEARDVLRCLPQPGESVHGLMTGRYDLMHLILIIVESRPEVPIECMRLATLSYNGRNLAEMLRLLDSGRVHQLSLICSTYFAEHDRDLYEETVQEFRKRGQRVAAPRSHAKVVTLAFSDGEKLVLEGSANLRTNSNREQFCLIHDAGLHDWHAAWMDKLITSHESNES